jgi:hypothetical protein
MLIGTPCEDCYYSSSICHGCLSKTFNCENCIFEAFGSTGLVCEVCAEDEGVDMSCDIIVIREFLRWNNSYWMNYLYEIEVSMETET